MDRDFIYNGYRIGEYGLSFEELFEIVEKKHSEGMNYVTISTGIDTKTGEPFTQQDFIEWAKYLTDKKIFFSFGGGGQRAHAGFTAETAKKMKEIAGKYFVSYELSELGTTYSCKPSGYEPQMRTKWNDLQHAKDVFVNRVKGFCEENSMGGILDTTVVEPSSMVSYTCEAGATFPSMEFWPGDMEISAAFVRGTSTAYNCGRWGVYMAHEWYGGLRYDKLKEKRFKMGYDYCYMAGGNYFINESGDERAGSHLDVEEATHNSGKDVMEMIGVDNFGYDHPVCQNYRNVMADFAKFTTQDVRPKGGPKVKVAFVRGNLDGYSFYRSGGSLWRGHLQPEYGYSSPEFAWRILDTIQSKRRWCDVHNYGEIDLSAAPAYGLYDVIPANVGADIFCKYDYLIFVGWNSMTEEIYSNLKEYVKSGGRLFMTAAHLNTSIKRDGSIDLLNNGDVSELFGCILDLQNPVHRDDGSKFCKSIVPEISYPSLRFECGDPYFAEGYINYADVQLTTGVAAARLSNKFIDRDIESMPISLVENKYGEGYAILMTNLEYPYGAAVPMYQNIVREILTASHRNADIKVYGSDSIRFSVYEGDKVYLLNTDFDNQATATIDYGTHKVKFTLEPCEFKPVEKTQMK